MHAFRARLGLGWPLAGLAGSALTACAATRLLEHRPIHWWWRMPLPGGHAAALHLFWAGVVALCLAWLGVGRRLATAPPRARPEPRQLVALAGAWALPLALGPALFSLDMYSYLAQGAVLHHGLNPYDSAPIVLQRWHETALLAPVSPIWRHTPTPYGPAFIAIASVIAGIVGSHVTLGVTLLRIPELFGLALLALAVPRLARRLGADPGRAVWLALCSPLTLLYLVGGGHNDLLMAGLLAVGVLLALGGAPLPAIAVCAAAAAVKLPALAAVGLVGVCWLRAQPRRRGRVLVAGGGVCAAVLGGVGALAGTGPSWISTSMFSTPQSVRIALTPATAVGVSLADALHGLGISANSTSVEQAAVDAAFGLVGLLAVWICLRVSYDSLVPYLGALLLAAALGGPVAWPWYLIWGVTLLAAVPAAQRSRWAAVALVACPFQVMAGGEVASPLPQAPELLLLYVLVAVIAAALALGERRAARLAVPRIPLPIVPHVAVPAVARPEPARLPSAESAG